MPFVPKWNGLCAMLDERVNCLLGVLPGAELVAAGIADLQVGILSIHALLVLIGKERMQRAGLDIPSCPDAPECPEHALYDALCEQGDTDAHSRYNAYIRRLVSFERALEGRQAGGLPSKRSIRTPPVTARSSASVHLCAAVAVRTPSSITSPECASSMKRVAATSNSRCLLVRVLKGSNLGSTFGRRARRAFSFVTGLHLTHARGAATSKPWTAAARGGST